MFDNKLSPSVIETFVISLLDENKKDGKSVPVTGRGRLQGCETSRQARPVITQASEHHIVVDNNPPSCSLVPGSNLGPDRFLPHPLQFIAYKSTDSMPCGLKC
jgi:hypothetical protein